MKFLWFLSILLVVLRRSVVSFDDLYGFDDLKAFEDLKDVCMEKLHPTNTSLMVSKSIIEWASVKGAVCLDGSPPAYYMHPGHGSGADSWVINLEGGGWCNNLRVCQDRAKGRHGSSACMAPELPFDGILSNKSEENPDFFNWNRVLVRYCDGASFTGHSQNKTRHLNFRGQKIWVAVMEELMSKGMRNANQALLTGCSAGGLATILHCDEFGDLFPTSTNVKCFSDAGLFLDVVDVHGYSTLRKMFGDVVNLQGVKENLPKTCTDHMDPTSCFFPQNFIARIKTPMFILNAAYDVWQVQESLTKGSDDWHACARNHSYCNASQIDFLQGFRNQMLDVVKDFSKSKKNGLFINSCFDHCQTKQDRWFAEKSPRIDNKTIAESVGDWYFDRSVVKKIDRPYPCDKTCINIEQRV